MSSTAGAGRGRRGADGARRPGAARGTAARTGGSAGRGGAPRRAAAQGARARGAGMPGGGDPTRDVHDPEGVRLQKVLASAGLGSRRACEVLITDGRVSVDGVVVRELGVRVDPARAAVALDGVRVQVDGSRVTLALNKPRGVVSTMHDPQGRPSLTDLVGNRPERLFHVGRLDAESEGLLLLTNDGDLANLLSHPGHGVAKTYLVEVDGRLPRAVGRQLLEGIELDDGPARVDRFHIVDGTSQRTLVEVVLHEGRNRIVRRMFEEVGHPVSRLVRTQIGPIRLGDLKPGRTRVLSTVEVGSLMTQAGL